MASMVSASATFICSAPRAKFAPRQTSFSSICGGGGAAGGLKMVQKIQISKAATKLSSPNSRRFKTRISCSSAETLEIVQSTIAKQLSIDESSVTPKTKFADLGADSLDTVEIMMVLEEKFGVSIGESGVENIATVQDAADLIDKVKAAS